MDALSNLGRIILVAVDEVHKCLKKHWGGSFRKDMLSVPAELMVQANPISPCIAMSATLSSNEIIEIQNLLKMTRNLVVIKQNPILPNFRIMNIARPKSSVPFDGCFNINDNLVIPGVYWLTPGPYFPRGTISLCFPFFYVMARLTSPQKS